MTALLELTAIDEVALDHLGDRDAQRAGIATRGRALLHGGDGA